MASFTQTYTIESSPRHVWQALTDAEKINEWGAGPALMDDTVGYEFELWGGDVWGKNIEALPQKKLTQEWFTGEWESPSIVSIELTGTHSQTSVTLTHQDFPESEQPSLESGWSEYFFGPLKAYLEQKKSK